MKTRFALSDAAAVEAWRKAATNEVLGSAADNWWPIITDMEWFPPCDATRALAHAFHHPTHRRTRTMLHPSAAPKSLLVRWDEPNALIELDDLR